MFSDFGPSFFGYGSPGRFRQGAPSPQQFGRQVDRGFGRSSGDMSDVFDIGPFGLPLGLGMMPSFGLPSLSMPSPTTAMGTQTGIGGDPGEGRVNPLWVDVFEAPDHFRLVADIPGVRKENVKINLQRNNILCIQADRMFPRPDDEQQMLSCERDYGRYRRHLRLPAGCNRDKMQAKCLDGQLIITIPRHTHGQIEQEHLPEEHVSVPLRDKSVEHPRDQETVSQVSPLSQQRQFDQQQQQQQQQQQGQVPSLLGVGGLPVGQKEKEKEREIEKEKPSVPSQPIQQWEKEKEKEKEYPTQQWQKEKEYPKEKWEKEKEPMDLGISDVSGTSRPSTVSSTGAGVGAGLRSDAGLGRAPTAMPQQQQQYQQVQQPLLSTQEKEKEFQQPQVLPQVREEKHDFGITEKDKEPLPSTTSTTATTAAAAVPLAISSAAVQPQPPSTSEFGVSRKDKKPEKEEYETEQMRGLTQPTQPVRPLEREHIQPKISEKPSEKVLGKDREEPASYGYGQEKPSMLDKVKGALGLGQKEKEKEPISSYTTTQGVLGKEKEQLPLGYKEREQDKISPGQEQQFKQYPTQYPSTSSYGRDQEERERGWDREREREKAYQPVRPFDREKDRDFFGRDREREREPQISEKPSEKLFGKEREEPTSYGYGQGQEKPSMLDKVKGALGLGQKEKEKEPISSYTAPATTQGVLGKEKDQLPLGYKEREQDKISPGQEQQFKQYPSTSSYGRDQEERERGWDREREREKAYQPTTGVSSMPALPQQQKWESQASQAPSEIQTQQQGLGVGLSQQQLRDTGAVGQEQVPSPAGSQRRAARAIPVQLGIYHHSV